MSALGCPFYPKRTFGSAKQMSAMGSIAVVTGARTCDWRFAGLPRSPLPVEGSRRKPRSASSRNLPCGPTSGTHKGRGTTASPDGLNASCLPKNQSIHNDNRSDAGSNRNHKAENQYFVAIGELLPGNCFAVWPCARIATSGKPHTRKLLNNRYRAQFSPAEIMRQSLSLRRLREHCSRCHKNSERRTTFSILAGASQVPHCSNSRSASCDKTSSLIAVALLFHAICRMSVRNIRRTWRALLGIGHRTLPYDPPPRSGNAPGFLDICLFIRGQRQWHASWPARLPAFQPERNGNVELGSDGLATGPRSLHEGRFVKTYPEGKCLVPQSAATLQACLLPYVLPLSRSRKSPSDGHTATARPQFFSFARSFGWALLSSGAWRDRGSPRCHCRS